MANIIPKLNLNKTPNLVETNSLVFAKNIRLDNDGSIHRDYGIFPLSIAPGTIDDTTKVNYNNILNRIRQDIILVENSPSYYNSITTKLRFFSGETSYPELGQKVYDGGYNIVGHIEDSNSFYIFIQGFYKLDTTSANGVVTTITKSDAVIIKYDETSKQFSPCNCNWTYSGGTISGQVINNLLGETILIIAETNAKTDVPLKCINLMTSSITDDESLYTQTPNIPITNLNYKSPFSYVIPNGVYQFFIRYKIRKDFYTDWFPASKEVFAGNTNNIMTSFGSVKYMNTNRSSDNSFTFTVEHLTQDSIKYYQSFQIGFICSSDDTIVARAWKHFNFDVTTINFDYKDSDSYDIEVSDLTKPTYQLYNVGNVTSFKNKLYISNYKETNFNNSNLQRIVDEIKIKLEETETPSGYAGNEKITSTINGTDVISGVKVSGTQQNINGRNGIIHQLLNPKNETSSSYTDTTAYGIIRDAVKPSSIFKAISLNNDKYGFHINVVSDGIEAAKEKFKNDNPYPKFNYIFEDILSDIKINGVQFNSYSVDEIVKYIYDKGLYLNDKAEFVDAYNNKANIFKIEIAKLCRYSVNTTSTIVNPPNPLDPDNPGVSDPTNSNIYNPGIGDSTTETVTVVTESEYVQTITITFSGDAAKMEESNNDFFLNCTTLIPYQKYKFYVHYIKQNGEITNGYYCGGQNASIIEVPYRANANAIIYPTFSNIQIPTGYIGCFFSILHIEREVATVYNLKNEENLGEANCIDINLGLFPGINKLCIRQSRLNEKTHELEEIIDANGKYYYSSDASIIRYFGADGIVTYDNTKSFDTESLAYLINEYSISEEKNLQLIKCTPFINSTNLDSNMAYSDYVNMNLLGYICKITPLLRDRTTTYYTDGASVFIKSLEQSNTSDEQFIAIKELYNHLGDGNLDESVLALRLAPSNNINIYSNYNLNYLALNEEPVEKFQSYYTGTSNATDEKAKSIILRLLKSAIMSNVYKLPNMYKTYTRKLYTNYNTEDILQFDNTIRSSELQGDENGINIFKFNANDYYNVPTNRGIIVNLEAIGDAILVHTKNSMFKFTGSNTLTSSDGEIIPTESQPFDTGVSEMFGSDFGFGGLQYKTDSITTENGYIFFDRDSGIIYMYGGQNNLVKISDSIEKLFRYKDTKSIHFANDYYNNRFFVSIIFKDSKKVILPPSTGGSGQPTYVTKDYLIPVTLSFNFSETNKAFVSLHDFVFDEAFNTKTKCYFITGDKQDICYINKKENLSSYTKLEIANDTLYPSKKDRKRIELYKTNKTTGNIEDKTFYNINSFYSIVDVIVNNNYETIKTLNSVNWYSSIIDSEFSQITDLDESTLRTAEDNLRNIPCNYIRIYTDTCLSPLLKTDIPSNNYNLSENESYIYPRYNRGIWTLNYFRNILDSNGNKTPYINDENSLIEGKYFVIRFMFNEEFKLETLFLNYSNKV